MSGQSHTDGIPHSETKRITAQLTPRSISFIDSARRVEGDFGLISYITFLNFYVNEKEKPGKLTRFPGSDGRIFPCPALIVTARTRRTCN